MNDNNLLNELEHLKKKVEALEKSQTGRLHAFLKRAFTKTSVLVGVAIAAVVTGAIIYAAQNVFVDGTIISAADVNSNFTELYGRAWSKNGSDLYYSAGNVGIGMDTPGSKLAVNGIIQSTSGGIKLPDGSVIDSIVYGQLEKTTPGVFAGNAWTDVSWDSLPVSRGISVSSANITFSKTGIYRITLTYRADGSDVWTGVRLYGNGSCRGRSAGWGSQAMIAAQSVTFLAEILDASYQYQLQFGRIGAPLNVIVPGAIMGETLPAIQAQIEKIN